MLKRSKLSLAFRLLLLVALIAAAMKEVSAQRFPIRAAEVERALAATGLNVEEAHVSLPAQLTASEPQPDLEPGSAQAAGETQLRVRFICRVTGTCLPFMASLTFQDPLKATAALQLLGAHTVAHRTEIKTSVGLHAGQPTVLLLQDSFMCITLPVLSIDTGRSGTEVRVQSIDHKQTYHGIVAPDGTVRGTLP